MLSNVAIGRMPFLLGIALAVAAWSAARSQRRVLSGVLALAAMLASPVAGVFLMLGAVGEADRRRPPALQTALWLGLPALAGGIGALPAVPRGRDGSLHGDRVLADARDLRRGRRAARARPADAVGGRAAVLGVLVGAFVVPTPFGQNALRLGVLAGPSVLALAHRKRVPVLALAVVGVGLLYLQWLPAVRAVAEAHGDPSTRLAFQAEARDFLARVAKPGERVEVPMTVNHWEAADLAKVVPLARGWERQLDQKANPIFYDGEPMTAVDVPRVAAGERGPLGRAPERAAGLLRARRGDRARARREVPQARLRVPALADLGGARAPTRPPPTARSCSPPARTGSWSTRPRRPSSATATRSTGRRANACVARADDGWTEVEPRNDGGVILVQAKFGLERGRDAKGVSPRASRSRRPSSLGAMRSRLLPRGARDLLWQIVLFCGAYWLYRLVRGQVCGSVGGGVRPRARHRRRSSRSLHVFVEPRVQHWAIGTGWVDDVGSWMYLNTHFVVTTCTLAFIYLFRNEHYYFVRNMFMVAMGLALVGYVVYPTAPPRMLPELGFVDSVATSPASRRTPTSTRSSTRTPRCRRCTSASR